MAHYIDNDIVTSRHLLAPRDTLRSRAKKSSVITTQKTTPPAPETGTKLKEDKTPSPKLADFKARKEQVRARYVKSANNKNFPRSPFGIKPSKNLELAWYHIPLVSRILVTGVLLTVLSLTTPFWAYVKSYNVSHATFGLWHFCIDTSCWSIHDNLIHGRDVPLWYMVSQMTFTIGVICATLAMFVVTSNHHGQKVRLSPTTNSTMVMMLVVGVLQMSTGLYTFISYFEDVSFMYEYSEDVEEVDFYGSFWLGVTGTLLILLAAMMLFFDEEIMPYPEGQYYLKHGRYPPRPRATNGYLPDYPMRSPKDKANDYPHNYPPDSPNEYPPDYPPDYHPDYSRDYPPDYPPDYPADYPPDYPPDYAPEYYYPADYAEGYPSDYPMDYDGGYPADYDADHVYPDNVLFSDMAAWDDNMMPPIVSQDEVPCRENPAANCPRPDNAEDEEDDNYPDYLKKAT